MTRALLAALPDFAPTPLQRAALKRIGELCKELAGYGLYPRTSMELEFFVQTDGGVHMPGVVKLDKALEFLQQEGIFGLDKVETEGEARRLNLPQIAKQYEVTLDDREGFHPVLSGKRPDFHPEAIALGVLRLKQNALQRMLESSTCLQNVRGLGQLGTLLPNFDARPYPTRTDTSGLNVNISLTDREGRNMFSASLPLLYHCADGVANAQHDTLLALLPMENSVKRIGANPSAPAGIGVVTGKPTTYSPYNSVYIRGVEHPDGASNIVATDLARVENRLPGADADPFLAMAVTLAGTVQAVRQHMHITPVPGQNRLRVKVDAASEPASAHRTITTDHSDIRTRFQATDNARKLLGNELYEAVLKEYVGPQAAR